MKTGVVYYATVLRRGRGLARVVTVATVGALCAAAPAAAAAGAAAPAPFAAHGSVEQVYATGLRAGESTVLLNRLGRVVRRRRASALGGIVYRAVKPGLGYRVRRAGGARSGPLTVLTKRSAPPSESVYDQKIEPDGYQYLTTRDGTQLAINVHPASDAPTQLGVSPPLIPNGSPAPVLIEYSGYGYARPEGGPESGLATVGNLMGFTVVDVNMRGTGCSGGSFDFFEPLQSLDAYDVIETIARQPWTQFGKVGMFGISYGGISQLFAAQTRPPHLAAIAPISLIDQVQTTLYPGGLLNTGFAYAWAEDRAEDAKPAGPKAGQPWAYQRIQGGDQTCAANQTLHAEAPNILRKAMQNDTYKPEVADPLSPITFVDKINVPTFLACQWEDEQTGGHCPTLAARLTGTRKKWATFTNGTHPDSLSPPTANRWFDFLQLYVAHRNPLIFSPVLKAGGPALYQLVMGVSGVQMPPDPVQQKPTYEAALAEFEKTPLVTIHFDNGAGAKPGQPLPGFTRTYPSLPVPGTRGRTWYFANGGQLAAKRSNGKVDTFRWDPKARPLDNHDGSTGSGQNGIWTATPVYDWRQPPAGTAASYVSEPLAADTIVVGAGYVEAWVRASRPNADFQATVTEIRPDGKETYVQSGWLRGDLRKLDPKKSEPLRPVLSLRRKDIQPLPRNRYVKATIPLYYEGHAYRAGSRIRVIISAPGGDQPIWAFARVARKPKARVWIAHDRQHPSRLTLPVIPNSDIPTALPPCPSLRAQPCRTAPALGR